MSLPFPHIRKGLTGLALLLGLFIAPDANAVCSNPAGAAGDIIYNDDENVITYCDDTNWIAVRGSGGAAVAPTNGLILYYKLDETSGTTITDYSGSGHTGTWSDFEDSDVGNESVTGIVGTGLAFDTDVVTDGNDRINAGSATTLDNLGPLSVCLWVNATTAYGGNFPLVGKIDGTNPGWELGVAVAATNRLYFKNNMANQDVNQAPVNSFEYNAGWHFYCGTWDGNDGAAGIKVYKNGVELTASRTDNIATVSGDNAYNVYLGGPNASYEGEMDEVRIYDRELSGSEIATLYEATGGMDTSLVGHWKLDETSGSTINDATANGHDGTWSDGENNDVAEETTTGQVGNAIDFDGGTDFVDISNTTTLEPSLFTLAAWVRPEATSPAEVQGIFKSAGGNGFDHGFRIVADYNVAGRVTFRCDDNTSGANNFNVNNVLTAGVWTHLAMTWDGTTLVGYADGVQVGSDGSDSCGYVDASNAKIGDADGTEEFNGEIDDVRLYNRALSATEIQELTAACEEANMIYNADHHVPQYCAGGDSWVAMGPVRDGIDNGLAGHWKLDETSGSSITDSSGNGNTGTWVDGADNNVTGETANAKIDTGLTFDSTDDYITAGSDSTLDDVFSGGGTWAAWMYRNSPGESNNGRLFAKARSGFNEGCQFATSSNNDLFFECYFSGGLQQWRTNASTIVNDEWYHVAVTYNSDVDANDAQIYINGAPVTTNHPTSNTGTFVSDASADLILGNSSTLASRTYDGILDDMRSYDRALSDAEIMALYELGDGRSDPSLVGHWKMDEKSGTTAADSSGTGNDGTLTSFSTPEPWTSATPVNGGLLFDGTDDDISVASDASLSLTDMSFSAWVKFPGSVASGWRTILEHDRFGSNWYGFWKSGNGNTMHFRWSGSGTTDFLGTVVPDTWYHVAGTYDSGSNTARTYINGSLDRTISSSAAGTPNNTALSIGENLSGGETFDGFISDVKIYNRALSETEVDVLYKMGIGHCTNPTGKEGDLIYNDDAGVDALTYCDGADWQMIGKSN